MSYRRKKGEKWYSPRALVRAIQISPNTVRYTASKTLLEEEKEEEEALEAKVVPLNYSSYPSYGGKMMSKNRHDAPVIPKKKRKYWNYYDDYENDYGGGAIGFYQPPVERAYTYTPSKWSNFSYSNYVTDSDDNSNLIVKEPESYVTPSTLSIKQKINVWGDAEIMKIKEMARVCYLKMLDDRDYLNPKYQEYADEGKLNEKIKLYDSIYDDFIPGFTPLEQAIFIFHKLRDINSRANGKHVLTGRGERCPQFLREDYADPHINNQIEMNSLSKEMKLDILNSVSIIGTMGNQFKVEKEIGETEVHNSDIFRKKTMRDYGQLHMIEPYQRFLPNYHIRFLSKDLIVNVPVKTSEKKQVLIMLIDMSGSMNHTSKQLWVNALLIDRFRYVLKGEAEIYVSGFVSSTSQLNFMHIKNATDVENFWKNWSNYPGGGQTDMGRMVNYISEEIKLKRLHNLKVDLSHSKPEILIINDGQDRVGHDSFPYKVNAISLMEFSEELKNLCVATGGKQIRIDGYKNVTAYSSDGEQEVA